ncbi:MAG: ComEA family DNA-binding protein [Dictyoglomi bacterium]|nr:ComEA family DNA-binding protein [Dictyoglomota bacterium]
MKDYISVWMKWVAITVVVATLLFFVGYHMGYRKASVSCALSSLTSSGNNTSSHSNRQIAVYVVGEVINPGVYTLPTGSRLQQAVEAAGGFTASADMIAVNLAMKLVDGMKIYIPPRRYEGVVKTSGSEDGLINVNMSSASELEKVPGIGPVLASRIVEYREQYGPFTTYEDLLKVQGIGEKTLAKIKPYIQVP